MGYQESMLVCNTKENFEKLCKKLNASKTELSDFVSVCDWQNESHAYVIGSVG